MKIIIPKNLPAKKIPLNKWASVKSGVDLGKLLKENRREKEVVSKRSENSKTFETGRIINGKKEYRWGGMIGEIHYKENYKNKNEKWKDIDINHRVDRGDYWLYDQMPIKAKLFKNKIGYEIESRRSGQKTKVELISEIPNEKDVDFEFDVHPDRIRLWKNIKHSKAQKKFRWKITEDNKKTGIYSLKFREKPEAFDVDENQAGIRTKKTKIDGRSFYWEEEFKDEILELPPKRKVKIIREFLESVCKGNCSKCSLKKEIKYPVKIDTDVNEQVGTGTDDAGHSLSNSCGGWATNESLCPGECCSNAIGDFGARFQTVAVPQGATISSAILSIYRSGAGICGNVLKLKIKGEDIDDAATFSTEANYNGRTRTTAAIDWDNTFSSTVWYNSPEIKTIIQEIVNRGGWSSNNDLVIFVANDGTVAGNFSQFSSYDDNPTYAPKLSITYTEGGTPKSVSDSGSGADSVSVSSLTKQVTDDGQGSESVSTPLIKISLGEEGSGADSGIIDRNFEKITVEKSTQKEVSDIGSGADTIEFSAKLSLSDLGTGDDTLVASTLLNISDVGTGNEDIVAMVSLAVTEVGSGSEEISVAGESKSIQDSGSGNEALSALITLAVSDTVVGSEIISALVQLIISDTGQGTDAIAVLLYLSLTDSGAGNEAVNTIVALSVQDSGVGLEVLEILKKIIISETGEGEDVFSIASLIVTNDSGSGADAVDLSRKIAIEDSGIGAELIGEIIGQVKISEVSIGVDVIKIPFHYSNKYSKRSTQYENKYF